MRYFLGATILLVSFYLAFYNVKKHPTKEITGPTVSLIFSALVGFALLLGLNFNISGFDTAQLNEKVQEAKEANEEAQKAKALAERALFESKEVWALALMRTGLLPSEESVQQDRKLAKEILQSLYKDNYSDKLNELKSRHVIPADISP